MTEEDMQFLLYVKKYCTDKPEVAAHVGHYASAGIKEALDSSMLQCSTIEAALLAAVCARFKEADSVLLSKLEDLKDSGKAHFKWDSFIDEFRAKMNKRKGKE